MRQRNVLRGGRGPAVEPLAEAFGRVSPAECLRQSWGVLLMRWPWDWFCSFTFREALIGPEYICKAFRGWWYGVLLEEAEARGMARVLPDKSRRGSWVRGYARGQAWAMGQWALAVEPHKSGKLHCHALCRLPKWCGDASYMNAAWAWKRDHGFCRVEPPRGQRGAVTRYVSKYVVKGGEVELSPGLTWSAAPLLARQAVDVYNGTAVG